MKTKCYRNKSRLVKPIASVLLLSVLLSCKKEKPEPEAVDRTVMVYMAANNSLAHVALANINQMEEGFQGIAGNLVVYARIFGQPPRLYRIRHDTHPEIRSEIVKTYPDHDSSDPAVMKMIFDDMQQLFPARSYGAILWSHATNWYPPNAAPSTRSFGDDAGNELDIKQLPKSLPQHLDFLIFDACSMASVEVLYELRDTAPYILASPTEVLSVGMPYNLIVKDLFHSHVRDGLIRVAQQCYGYYQRQAGPYQSATYTVVETASLTDLGQTTAQVLAGDGADFSVINRNSLQRMDFDPKTPVAAVDFLDFFDQYFSVAAYQRMRDATAAVVVYKISTERYLQQPIHTFSGLSCYVPEPRESLVHPYYLDLQWAKNAAFHQLFWWQ